MGRPIDEAAGDAKALWAAVAVVVDPTIVSNLFASVIEASSDPARVDIANEALKNFNKAVTAAYRKPGPRKVRTDEYLDRVLDEFESVVREESALRGRSGAVDRTERRFADARNVTQVTIRDLIYRARDRRRTRSRRNTE